MSDNHQDKKLKAFRGRNEGGWFKENDNWRLKFKDIFSWGEDKYSQR